jgi:hypothetical protein
MVSSVDTNPCGPENAGKFLSSRTTVSFVFAQPIWYSRYTLQLTASTSRILLQVDKIWRPYLRVARLLVTARLLGVVTPWRYLHSARVLQFSRQWCWPDVPAARNTGTNAYDVGRHLNGGTGKPVKNFSRSSWWIGRNLNPIPLHIPHLILCIQWCPFMIKQNLLYVTIMQCCRCVGPCEG